MNTIYFLVFINFVYGITAQSGDAEGMDYPIVSCQGDEVYPWFEGCQYYLQCEGSKAVRRLCPESSKDEKLNVVCGIPTSNCGYQCGAATVGLVEFQSPATGMSSTCFYGMCVKGSVISQSKCRTAQPNMSAKFDKDDMHCKLKCEGSDIIIKKNCTGWMECENNQLLSRDCPPGSLYDGTRCNFAFRSRDCKH